MFVLFIVLLFLTVLCIFLSEQRVSKILATFPEPPGKFFFGHALEIKSTTDFLKIFTDYIHKYGATVKLRAVSLIVGLLTTDYKLCEHVLSSNQILTKSQNYYYARRWLGNGLLVSDGNYWKRHRKILTSAFHFEILKQFVETFESVGNVLVRKLETYNDSPSTDLHPLVALTTLDVICETAMGTKINAQEGENTEYVKTVKEMCRIIIDRGLSPLKLLNITYWMTKDYYIEKKALKILRSFTSAVVNKRKFMQCEKQGTKKMALLDLMLKFTDHEGLFSEQEMREEVDTFMFEGNDTTASSICFVLYCLAKHPEIQEKVLEEQKELFENKENPLVSYQDLLNMKYLENVIKETLRLYPSVPVIGRFTTGDIYFENHFIPKNTNIGIFIYQIHRNPEYFPEPEKFNPDRFNNLNSLPPYAYIPFSAGPRNCIGQKFAMLVIKSIVSKVIRHFELKAAVPHHDLVLSVETVLKSANGFKVGIKRRN